MNEQGFWKENQWTNKDFEIGDDFSERISEFDFGITIDFGQEIEELKRILELARIVQRIPVGEGKKGDPSKTCICPFFKKCIKDLKLSRNHQNVVGFAPKFVPRQVSTSGIRILKSEVQFWPKKRKIIQNTSRKSEKYKK